MKISEAATQAKLSVKTVRFYADIGLIKPDIKPTSKYRDYGPAHIKKLIFARRAREFGFSIEQCRELLDLYEDQNRSSADVKRLASTRLAEIKQKQSELQCLHDELAHLVESCHGDERAECPIISNLSQSS